MIFISNGRLRYIRKFSIIITPQAPIWRRFDNPLRKYYPFKLLYCYSNSVMSKGGVQYILRHPLRGFAHLYIAIRKSKDYVYGIWVYKALDIWKGYYRVKQSLVSYMKPWTEARNNKYMKYHSKLTNQLSFWNVSRNVDYHAGGKWFIHGPKRRKENQLLSLKHPCWLSLV